MTASVYVCIFLCLAVITTNSYKFTNSWRRSSIVSSSTEGRSAEPKKWQVGNKGSTQPGGGSQGGEKDWKSGYVFNKQTQKKRRNDPWWMREEESNNPRILPAYKPWWVTDNVTVDETWKVADLRAEAIKRGMSISSGRNSCIFLERCNTFRDSLTSQYCRNCRIAIRLTN